MSVSTKLFHETNFLVCHIINILLTLVGYLRESWYRPHEKKFFFTLDPRQKPTLVHTPSVICYVIFDHEFRTEVLKDKDHIMLKTHLFIEKFFYRFFVATSQVLSDVNKSSEAPTTEKTKLHFSLTIICEKLNTKGGCLYLLSWNQLFWVEISDTWCINLDLGCIVPVGQVAQQPDSSRQKNNGELKALTFLSHGNQPKVSVLP